MKTTTVVLVVLAFITSLAIAYFQYYFKAKSIRKVTIYLFILRSLSLFLLLLLFINPTIKSKRYTVQKPVLSIVLDNSESVAYFKQDSLVQSLINDLRTNSALNKKFTINYYTFGTDIQLNANVDFTEKQTDIAQALRHINELNKEKNNPIVLVTDGNQTLGNDYTYLNIQNPVYPLVVGDTSSYEDLRIARLNVNRYSFLNNQFPVETMVFYDGNKKVNANFTIEKNGKTVYRKLLKFNSNKTTETVEVNLTSEKEGVQFYTAKVDDLAREKNTVNNTKSFSVEVINKQRQILILSAINHPDLGVLKKSIERDQQQKVTIRLIDSKIQIKDYQLIILYQPNLKFKDYFHEINKEKINYFLITGSQTDWNFINTNDFGVQKNSINQSENYAANFNTGYLVFAQKDINFSTFPPLKDRFGQLQITVPYQSLLTQNINGFSTNAPLLATADINNHKRVFLLGEGIWKWRSTSYQNSRSFNDFDEFLGKIVQYASSKKVRERLDIDIETLYNANSIITVGAFYVDENYTFDPRATILFDLKNEITGETSSFPFSLNRNSYQLEISALDPGKYSFIARVEGENIVKKGRFRISQFNVEEQFTNANATKLQRLTQKTGGTLFLANEKETFIKTIIKDPQYTSIQKERLKKTPIIDWLWILFLVVGLLSAEWFIRKYHGKI